MVVVIGGVIDGLGPADVDTPEQPTSAVASPAAPAPTPAVSAATPTPAPEPTTAATTEPADTPAGEALTSLAALRTKGRAPMTGYDRDLFGQAWADVDRNGCDQRNDVLARDLVVSSYKPGTRSCVVLTGTFDDPYTGTRIAFTRGQTSSMAVQIDHVVALADAWQTGAQTWGPDRLETFANDPLVLMAADGPANAQKGASDAASWLPPNKSFRCDYVARQVAIKAKYDLWVKPAERDAIARVLGACPGQAVPAAGRVAVPKDQRAAPPTATTPPRSSAPPAATGGPEVEYANCDAVRAAGKAPILAGEPGYSRQLDRDGDGQGCDV